MFIELYRQMLFAGYTLFWWTHTHMLTHIHTSQLRCVLWHEINYKHKCDTHFQVYQTIFMIFDALLLLIFYPSNDISTRPQWILPVQMKLLYSTFANI